MASNAKPLVEKVEEGLFLQVSALGVLSGIPVFWESPPGDGKTSLGKALLEYYGYQVIELSGLDLSPERIAGFPVPREGVVRYVADEALSRLREGGHALVLSEVNTLPPETLSLLLEMIRTGKVGGEALPFPIVMSANPESMAVGATPMGGAFANRVLYLSYKASPRTQDMALEASLGVLKELGGSSWKRGNLPIRDLHLLVEGISWKAVLGRMNLPPNPTEEDLPLVKEAALEARSLALRWRKATGAKYEEPPNSLREAFKPFFTRRSFSNAIAFLTAYLYALRKGWRPSGEVLLTGLRGILGERGVPLATWILSSEGLPSVEEVLKDPSLFPEAPYKGEALTHAIIEALEEKRDPRPGLNLVRGLFDLGRSEEAMRFLAALRKAFADVQLPRDILDRVALRGSF